MHPRRPRDHPGVGRKGATKVFKRGRKSPWLVTLTGSFPNGRVNAGSWLCAKKCFVLLCPISEQHCLSYFCVFVHDRYCLAVLYCTCPVRCSPRLCPIRSQHLLDCLTRLTAPGSPRIIFMLYFRKTWSSLVRSYLYSRYIFQVSDQKRIQKECSVGFHFSFLSRYVQFRQT